MEEGRLMSNETKVEIHSYDRDTLEYLRAAGVQDALVNRVEVMAREIVYKNRALAEAEARVEQLERLFAGKSEGS